ncbi:hypothetical protein NPIL_688981 [Nephila pilipes]|uniref:Uncharacterized protein n=1 Tax=Nephila pilipes TaxID=299642 RepID=A0A8X6QWH7_NEPPI|nr:hypothetical protein NPIL_688981 [Nephila pilipes]
MVLSFYRLYDLTSFFRSASPFSLCIRVSVSFLRHCDRSRLPTFGNQRETTMKTKINYMFSPTEVTRWYMSRGKVIEEFVVGELLTPKRFTVNFPYEFI